MLIKKKECIYKRKVRCLRPYSSKLAKQIFLKICIVDQNVCEQVMGKKNSKNCKKKIPNFYLVCVNLQSAAMIFFAMSLHRSINKSNLLLKPSRVSHLYYRLFDKTHFQKTLTKFLKKKLSIKTQKLRFLKFISILFLSALCSSFPISSLQYGNISSKSNCF